MNTSKHKPRVIVSMTSFPAAIPYAIEAIKSILGGSVIPDKLVLYLNFFQFTESGIPEELTALAQANPLLEIKDYDRNIRSYCKLIPALTDFPDDIIVTIDDDVRYHRHMLRDLLDSHRRHPQHIVANRTRRIKPDKPYRCWGKYRWYHFLLRRSHAGFRNLLTGVGGVLYPPHSLHPDMLQEQLFVELAPTTDDIWFWAAAVANGRRIMQVPFGRRSLHYVGKPADMALSTGNYRSGTDRNAMALKAIFNRYPEIRKTVEREP